jgi:glutaredoxin 3
MVLKRNGLEFTEVDVSDKRDWLIEKSGQRTVPQIYIGDYHVGGCDDLMAMESAGKLMPLARGEVPAS